MQKLCCTSGSMRPTHWAPSYTATSCSAWPAMPDRPAAQLAVSPAARRTGLPPVAHHAASSKTSRSQRRSRFIDRMSQSAGRSSSCQQPPTARTSTTRKRPNASRASSHHRRPFPHPRPPRRRPAQAGVGSLRHRYRLQHDPVRADRCRPRRFRTRVRFIAMPTFRRGSPVHAHGRQFLERLEGFYRKGGRIVSSGRRRGVSTWVSRRSSRICCRSTPRTVSNRCRWRETWA